MAKELLALIVASGFGCFFSGLVGFIWAIDIKANRKNLNKKVGCILFNMYSVIATTLYIVLAFPLMSKLRGSELKAASSVGMILSLAGLGIIIYKIMEEKE